VKICLICAFFLKIIPTFAVENFMIMRCQIFFIALTVSVLSSVLLYAQSVKTNYDRSGRKVEMTKTNKTGSAKKEEVGHKKSFERK
jgi:uncharacterized ion transporter superfamily protein YfcC